MNKRMAFIVILVTTVLLYDLVFHTTCFFPEQCYCLVHLVASVLYSHSYMPFAVLLQRLVEPFSNSNSGSGPYHSVPFYLAATVLILTLSALPCGFLAVSYLVISTTVGKSFDANSVYPTDLPLLFPSLNIFFGMLLIGYPCIKLVEYHYPGFCFGMVFRSKRLRYIYFSC